MPRNTRFAFVALAVIWTVIAGWQFAEHSGVEKAGRDTLINRTRDITGTLSTFISSQRRFGVVSQDRMEAALQALVTSGELQSIALLNAAGEIVASAGAPIDLDTKALRQSGVRWDEKTLTAVNLVDLGTNVVTEAGDTNHSPTIVLPRRDTNAPPPVRPPPGEVRPLESTNKSPGQTNGQTNLATNAPPAPRPPRPLGRPFWMNETEYKAMLEKRGLHGFVVALPTEPLLRATGHDFRIRTMIVGFAGVAALGIGLALRNVSKSADLQLRLMRASELNTHLREMNLAAAGLAHETKNPLNIIRGLAQMISKQDDTPPALREKSRGIVDEVDRVTAQLNEFINYSRPREVRRTPIPLSRAVAEVVRALGYDLEEKAIQLTVQPDLPRIEADEQLLRQALFNLLINATQAQERGGTITVSAFRTGESSLTLEISDDGPGVAPEHRKEIFKPYFTTHQKGTGLGLAVVQQIVLAHGWEIECLPNEPRGARFRLSHLKMLA
ncbi:MAG: hypothetical protein EBS05_20795 [Proteobacteria bacterium]|nr:hypothetical protein [Pseudomonadota bacterium]